MRPDTLTKISFPLILLAASATADAATWHMLESPALLDAWPGPDGLWTTGDAGTPAFPGEGPFGPLPGSGLTPSNDFSAIVPGTGGAASSNTNTDGWFGTGIGMIVTNGGAPDHPGVNTVDSWVGDGLFHHDGFAVVDAALGFSLDPTGTNELVVSPDGRTYSIDLTLSFPGGGSTVIFTGTGVNLFAGEDPATVFAGDPALASHFAFLAPLAPAGWEVLSTTFFSGTPFDIVSGAPLGYTTSAVNVQYSMTAPVPVPPAALLLGPALLALGGLRRSRTD